jgi:polyisoprenoid-binding protein YceI
MKKAIKKITDFFKRTLKSEFVKKFGRILREMSLKKRISFGAVVLVLGFGAIVLAVKLAKPTVDLNVGSSIWMEGNSTIQRYYLTATRVSVESEMDKSDSKFRTLAALILNRKGRKLTVKVPVEGLKTGDKGRDQIVCEKLRSKEFPDIVYTLNDYTVKAYPGSVTTYAILAPGKIKIAGVEKDIVLEATMVIGLGGIKIYGNQDIFQKDFGISPYSLAVIMTTDNKIVVHYMISL